MTTITIQCDLSGSTEAASGVECHSGYSFFVHLDADVEGVAFKTNQSPKYPGESEAHVYLSKPWSRTLRVEGELYLTVAPGLAVILLNQEG